jgi:hypothetical protein
MRVSPRSLKPIPEPIAMEKRSTQRSRTAKSASGLCFFLSVRIAKGRMRWAALTMCALLCAWPALADQNSNSTGNPAVSPASRSSETSAATHRSTHARRHSAKPSPAGPAMQAAPAQPPPPPKPDWPVNDKPVDATVVWDSHGLRVDAANSRLDQILKEISTDTGVKVEGLGASDVRIFGSYGPGPANEVISQLLNGTGYNVLMIGDQGAGAPRQIVLSTAPSGPAPQNSARGASDDSAVDQPAPMDQQNPVSGFVPPQMRTPQQVEEMQLRQEQIQQQLREQMLNQQQHLPPDAPAPPQ